MVKKYIDESKLLDIVVKYSPKKFHELKIYCVDYIPSELFTGFIFIS